jgi:PAS domain S-box-containing protein
MSSSRMIVGLISQMQTETVFQPIIRVGGSKTNPIHILHVDDDSSALEISKLMLLDIDARFEIDNACCVDEGLSKLANGHYDVVVSDYEMPQKSGLQFLQELREQNNEIPFILFTGKGREEVAIKALNLGADGYHNKQGSPETVYGELSHGINLTVDRRKAKLALSESERRYRALMEKASDAIFVHDVEGRIIDANQRACNSLGYLKEDLLGMVVGDIDKETVQSGKGGLMWAKVIAGESFVFEANQKRKDGSVFPVEVSLGPITFGDITFVMGLVRDITERKKIEDELKQKYDVLERVGENVGAGLAIIAKDYSIIWANKTLRDIMVDRNKKCYQIFNKLNRVCPDCGVKKIFEQNLAFETHEYEAVDSKGEKTWIELRVTPLKDKNGATIAALELAIPITERKRAEVALKESEAKHRDLADSLPEIVFEIDLKGNLTYANNNAFIITGYTKQDFAKGICIFDLI